MKICKQSVKSLLCNKILNLIEEIVGWQQW